MDDWNIEQKTLWKDEEANIYAQLRTPLEIKVYLLEKELEECRNTLKALEMLSERQSRISSLILKVLRKPL